jgi:WD40 repeat protein/tetratricopeptide (TPR) repeat protein
MGDLNPEDVTDVNWRIKEIRKRVEQHKQQERSDALIAAAKKAVLGKKKQLAIVKKYKERVFKNENATKRSITKFSKRMESFLDGADRQWLLNRDLRSMEVSYRGSSERLRDSRFLLNVASRRIMDIKDKIGKPIQANLTTIEKVQKELKDDVHSYKTVGEQLEENEKALNGTAISNVNDDENVEEDDVEVKHSEKCKYCNKVILLKILVAHQKICQFRSQERVVLYAENAIETSAEEMDTALPPQPPLNVKVVSTTCETITFSWIPPIFDGGASIQGYEIRWQLCHKKRIGKKIQRTYETLPPIWTTTWCLKEPIMNHGYTIKNLEADLEFANITVHSKSRVGYSPPSNVIESAETNLPVAPTEPLFLQVKDITASTIELTWKAPLFSGGSGGVENFRYEIQYTYQKQTELNKNKEPGLVDVREKVLLDTPETRYVIENLRGLDVVRLIIVSAINKFDIKGPPSHEIMSVQTKPPKSSQVFRQELERVKKIKGRFVESNLHQGFMQRFEKENFISILEGKLKIAEQEEDEENSRQQARDEKLRKAIADIEGPSLAELEAAHKEKYGDSDNEAKGPENEEDDGNPNKIEQDNVTNEGDDDVYGFLTKQKKKKMDGRSKLRDQRKLAKARMERMQKVRERHFMVRIDQLKKQIQVQADKRSEIIAARAEIFYNIKLWAKRVNEVKPEVDRASLFQGKYMDSSVMHYKPQRFLTKGLISVLVGELNARLKDIADGKEEMIMLEKEAVQVLIKQEQIEDKLRDREAAFLLFQKEAARQRAAQKHMENWSNTALKNFYYRWIEYVEKRRDDRKIVGKFIKRILNSELHGAFQHWIDVIKQLQKLLDNSKAVVGGVGTQSLSKVSEFRHQLENETALILDKVSKTQVGLDDAKKTSAQRRAAEEGKEFFRKYKSEDDDEVTNSLGALELADYNIGGSYAKSGDFVKAIFHFTRFSDSMKASDNILMMAKAWCAMGDVYTDMQVPEKAQVTFDRAIQLSREARSTRTLAASYYGMGRAFESQMQHRTALRYIDRSQRLYSMMRDHISEGRCYRLKADVFKALNDLDGIRLNGEMANKIEFRGKQDRARLNHELSELQKKLSSATADSTDPFYVEVCTPCVPRIRQEIKEKLHKIKKIEDKAIKIDKDRINAEKFLQHMRDQLVEANNSESTYMDSDSVHGAFQRFNVRELRTSLAAYIEMFEAKINEMKKERHRFDIRKSNQQDDLNELYLEFDTENGEIMKNAMEKQLMRACCLNPVNARGHDVLGGLTGGIENFAFAAGKRIHLHNMEGTCERIIEGDELGTHIGDPTGHVKMISSLCFFGNRIYSGSMDNSIFVWELGKKECISRITGHKATVCAIDADAVKIVSGSADNEVRVWNAETFELAAVLTGHKRAPKCIHVGPNRFVTGGNDYEVRVWKVVGHKTDPFRHISCERRMLGHGAPVTAIKLAVSEIVSGGANGTLIVWSIKHGRSLWKVQAHESSISCLQFDSVKIISGGRDMSIMTHDISSGKCLQTLRGHSSPIVALDFDKRIIMSVSNDGMIRRWPFRIHGQSQHEEKWHILGPNEHISYIAKMYDTTVANIKEWNNIVDVYKLYCGQRLIVQKERKHKKRMVCSPAKAKKDAERLKANKKYVPIEDRLSSTKLSDKAALEVGKAGRVAVDALSDIKNRFTQGSKVQERIDELATITAAATGTTVAI